MKMIKTKSSEQWKRLNFYKKENKNNYIINIFILLYSSVFLRNFISFNKQILIYINDTLTARNHCRSHNIYSLFGTGVCTHTLMKM